MIRKISISQKIRDKKWELYEKKVILARKIRESNFRFSLRILKVFWGFNRRIKDFKNRSPGISILIKRLFEGFGGGIKYGIKDAINSWKFDRDYIEDYDIEIQSLSFHAQ